MSMEEINQELEELGKDLKYLKQDLIDAEEKLKKQSDLNGDDLSETYHDLNVDIPNNIRTTEEKINELLALKHQMETTPQRM